MTIDEENDMELSRIFLKNSRVCTTNTLKMDMEGGNGIYADH